MGTSGRYTIACESLASFLQQSITHATLLIYNQHPVPLHFDHPRVRVVNEAPPPGSLRYIRQRMHKLANPAATFIHWWDDDDLYLPWHLEDCLSHIGDNVAWKPVSSWLCEDNEAFSLEQNTFEGSWIFRADYVKTVPIDAYPSYTDHPVIWQTIEQQLLATTELGSRASYIYRWNAGSQHVSAYGAAADEGTQGRNLETWRQHSDDVRPDGRLVPADLRWRWRQYLEGTRDFMTSEEWSLNRAAVTI